MATIQPFRALRPKDETCARGLVSVPYDVVDAAEAAKLAEGLPLSFLRVTRSEIEMPGIDPYSDAVYERAAANMGNLLDTKTLIVEDRPSLYVYRMENAGHVQTGLAARFSTADYKKGIIKKHELTRKDKEDDRTRHIDSVSAQTGPVLLFHKDSAQGEIRRIVTRIADNEEALYDVSAADGVRHKIYRIADEGNIQRLVELYKSAGPVYIADGHHRAASAARVAALRASQGKGADFGILAVCFPDVELNILPYNRAVKDLHGQDVNSFLTRLGQTFTISEKKGLPGPREFGLYTGGRWYLLRAPDAFYETGSVTDHLDVSVMQNHLLHPVLGIDDPRTSVRIAFVGGIRGEQELERLVDSGGYAASFSLPPVRPADLVSVADADMIMPPKSTWFEPKLRDGFVVNSLDL